MKKAEAILSIKFKSKLSRDVLSKVCQADLENFRTVPGLIQKYFISEELTGFVQGICLFETKSARKTYWNSRLAKSLPVRYGIIPHTLRVERFDMEIVLNEAMVA